MYCKFLVIIVLLGFLKRATLKHDHPDCEDICLERVEVGELCFLIEEAFEYGRRKQYAFPLAQLNVLSASLYLPIV